MKTEGYGLKAITLLALPTVVGSIAHRAIDIVDTAFLGALGEAHLGASGNMILLYVWLVTLGLGFCNGYQIIAGRRNGEKAYKAIGANFYQSFWFLLFLSFLILATGLMVVPLVLPSMVTSETMLNISLDYFSVRIWCAPLAMINALFVAFCVATKNTRFILYATLILAGLNVFLDYALIFGKFGLPEMGVKGAALASVLAELGGLIYFLFVVFGSKIKEKYGFANFVWPRRDKLKPILSIATPTMAQQFLTIGSWFFFFKLIEYKGEAALAVSHVIRSIYMILMIPLFGFSSVANSLVSNLIGEGREDMVLGVLWKVIAICNVFILLLVTAGGIFSDDIFQMYNLSSDRFEAANNSLGVIQITSFFLATAFVFFHGVSGTGQTKIALYIEIFNLLLYCVFAYLIIMVWSSHLHQVWYAEFTYFIIMGLLSYFYLKGGKWKGKVF